MNPPGQAALANGLGQADPGLALKFNDPNNAEALAQALSQARTTGEQAVLRLERGEDDGPCFGYVAPVRSLADIAYLSGLVLDGVQGGFALLFPAVEETGRLWGSMHRNFGLTPAELRLAERVRDGQTLKEAAEALGTSINTVRNQLRAIFDKMGLKRQSDLVRALMELGQVAGVMDGVASASPPMPAPPVMFQALPDGRRLAYRDYGALGGRTLLMFHEGMGSSLLPPGLQSLATDLGVRVIAAERPGFGRSDPRPDYSFDGVAEDMVAFATRSGWRPSGSPQCFPAHPRRSGPLSTLDRGRRRCCSAPSARHVQPNLTIRSSPVSARGWNKIRGSAKRSTASCRRAYRRLRSSG